MPIILFAVIGLAGLVVWKRANGANRSLASSNSETSDSAIQPVGPNANQSPITQIAAATTGGLIGAQVGQQINTLLGLNRDVSTTVAATAAGAIAGVAIALAAIGTIAWPIAAILVLYVTCYYAVTAVVTDIWRQTYGQAGATEEYRRQWRDIESKIFTTLRANPDFAHLTDSQIRRMSVPTADGFMIRNNQVAFAQFMNSKGLLGIASTNWEHAQYGESRGYFAGNAVYPGTLKEHEVLIVSNSQAHVMAHVPPSEQIQVKVSTTTVRENNPRTITVLE